MTFPYTTLDIIRNSLHSNDYTYYKMDSNESLTLSIQYDKFTPHAFVSTIRDSANEIDGTWGYVHEMYPNATLSQKMKFTTTIRDAWAQWICDMENHVVYNLAIDNKFTPELAKRYISQIQNKEAL